MNTRKIVFWFWTTIVIGSIAGAVVGVLIDLDMYLGEGPLNFILGVIWMLGISAAISVVAQMGFFAYLTVHRFALSLFKSVRLWNWIQWVLIAFVFFDLIFLRYWAYAEPGETLAGYFIMPILLLVFALIIAYWKMKETNRSAFVPALFFMYVITTIEWIPALTVEEVNNSKWLWIYLSPLLAANSWQLLLLHRLYEKPEGEDGVRKEADNNAKKVGEVKTKNPNQSKKKKKKKK
ncbi:KinB-signaling pathway activation protein [Salsuginibacillus kocurii]|uniref:KinB-signaling pathway activation protein n=1 Tax=Salsuginibacillus kocurii TaxID=427078 RepID=UPI00036681DA|nr:KinB-signaling pathway activation protein [Salsuginibacillus kocurii]